MRRAAVLAALATLATLLSGGALAQATPPAPAAPPAPPAAAAAASEPQAAQRVEVNAQRDNDTEARRRSTAAKIVIGREEIERHGDATLGEVLRRLPGVTSGGPPGRGGPPRIRGLGGGYTQILLDGERVPPGFSIDSLSPEQVERIEVQRAPSAETGARAMAGTINIVTREGFAKKFNDLRLGSEFENGRTRPSLSWTLNGRPAERWNANLSFTLSRTDRAYAQRSQRLEHAPDGSVLPLEAETVTLHDRHERLNLGTRWQWMGPQGESLTLSPFVVWSEGRNRRDGQLQALAAPSPGSGIVPSDHQRFDHDGVGRFAMLRVFGQARHRLGDTRLEWRGGAGAWRSSGHSLRREFAAGEASPLHTLQETSRSREHSANAALKASRLLDSEHSLVGGVEFETVQRDDQRQTLRDGALQSGEFGDALQATTERRAAYLQDEWQATPNWALHAGLRWEAITTQGSGPGDQALRNRSAVWTPLLHALWKPDPQGRDQLRLSLTRSYRTPTVQNLLGRPTQSANNSPSRPDRAGNPALQPELAGGLDIALERYLAGGGVLSANLFHRRIQDLIRSVTALETDASGNARWVARPRNVGRALTQGLELEAKFRLTDLLPDGPPTDVRSNLALYRSRVASVPGPDNRLEQQPHASFNLGLDQRLRGLPLTLGGNFGWTPAYDTRLAGDQWTFTGRKRVWDAYALWTLRPDLGLRLSVNNLDPEPYLSASRSGVESTSIESASYRIWQLRLEMKL